MRSLLFGASILFCAVAMAQPKKLKSLELREPVSFASVDRPGDLYIVYKNGSIEKISKEGDRIANAELSSAPDLFDPRDGVLAFSYHRNENKFSYLSPDLTISSTQAVHPEFAVRPWLICPSKNEIWILDSVDLSLKKTAGNTYLIQKDIPWSAAQKSPASQLTHMREYQNFLFVLDRTKGVEVFNSFGKWIKTLGVPGLQYFNFLGEEFYYHEKDLLQFTDLYTTEKRVMTLPALCDFALLTDERMFLIAGTHLDIFEYKP